MLLRHQAVSSSSRLLVGGVLSGDAQTGDVLLGNSLSLRHMALGVHGNLVQAAELGSVSGVGVHGHVSAVDVHMTVGVASGDGGQGSGQLALDGGNHSGVVILLTADTSHNAVKLGDGGVHRRSVIRMLLNPVGNLSQSVQRILSALGNQLGSQFLVGDGADALAGVRANQGVHIGLGGLRSQHGGQSGVEVRLGHLSLVGQSSQTLDRNVCAVDSQSAVGSAGGNQDVHHLIGDSQSGAVDLDAFEDVRFSANFQNGFNLLLRFLSEQFQVVELGQVLSIVRHFDSSC